MKRFIEDLDRVNRFAEYIKIGCSIKGACGGIGISESYFYAQMRKAEADIEANNLDTPEVHFYHIIKKAEQEFETYNLNIIKSHATDDWKAAAWLLERRRQKEYVVRQDIQLSTPEKITINMDVTPTDGNN